MALDRATVAHIAKLARIRVDDGEIEVLSRELGQIIGWVEQLAEVDTEGIEPMTGAGRFPLPQRDDVVDDGGDAQRVLANAPERHGDFFTVPKVVE